jgi:hypothetical protein
MVQFKRHFLGQSKDIFTSMINNNYYSKKVNEKSGSEIQNQISQFFD